MHLGVCNIYIYMYIHNLIYIYIHIHDYIYLYGMYDSLMTSCSGIAILQGTGQMIPSAIFSWCAKVRDTGAFFRGGSQGLAGSASIETTKGEASTNAFAGSSFYGPGIEYLELWQDEAWLHPDRPAGSSRSWNHPVSIDVMIPVTGVPSG